MNPKLEKYIATRDKRMKDPVSKAPLREQFDFLLKHGKAEVGGRASCGSTVDPTWKFFCAWGEIIKKSISLGYKIEVEGVKHANGSPTRAGGFWNSNVYTLISNPFEKEDV